MKKFIAVLAGLVLALTLTACGDDSSDDPTPTATPADSGAGDSSDAEGVVVDITIAGGKVTPQGKRVDVKVGEPVTLRVTSDAEDEIHVHSDPEHGLDVVAGDTDKELTFTLDTPGQVAVESHHLDATIVQLVVKP